MQLFIKHCIYWFTKICLQRKRLVIDVICRSIQWREGPLSAFKNPQQFYIPVDYVYILMLSCVWFWAIVKLFKRTDFLCKLKETLIDIPQNSKTCFWGMSVIRIGYHVHNLPRSGRYVFYLTNAWIWLTYHFVVKYLLTFSGTSYIYMQFGIFHSSNPF